MFYVTRKSYLYRILILFIREKVEQNFIPGFNQSGLNQLFYFIVDKRGLKKNDSSSNVKTLGA